MSTIQKFAFDTDFAEDKKKADVPRIDLADHHKLVTQSREEGYRHGHADAEKAAEESLQRAHVMALNSIGDAVARAVHALEEIEGKLETEALEIAVAVAKKLAGKLIESEPMEAIRTMVADCLVNMRQVPHLVVRVNDQLFEVAQEDLNRMAQERGFGGKLVIMSDPALAMGDARIEWSSGGIVVDRLESERRIDETINNFLLGRHGLVNDMSHGDHG